MDLYEVGKLTFNYIRESYAIPCSNYSDFAESRKYKARTVKVEQYCYYCFRFGMNYHYLYDTNLKKWFLYYKNAFTDGKVLQYDLSKLLTNKKYLEKYIEETDSDFNGDTVEKISQGFKRFQTPVNTYINSKLKDEGIYNVEVDYTKDKNGNKVYGLFQIENGKQRRKCVVKSVYLCDLMMYLGYCYRGEDLYLSFCRSCCNKYKKLLQIELSN